MMLVLHFVVAAAAMMVLSRYLPGFQVDGWGPAVIAAIVLAFANAVVRPILFLITLPLTIVTLGLFLLVLNVLMLYLTAAVVPGFHVHGFGTTLVASIVLSLVGMLWKGIAKGL
jgi:putative membrane protein